MKLKYYLRGIGIGVIVATLIMTISGVIHNNNLSDEFIIKEALKLGMIMPEKTDDKDGLWQKNTENETENLVKDETENGSEDEALLTEENDTESRTETHISEETEERVYVSITVEEGDGANIVSSKLKSAGAIDDEEAFHLYLKENGYATKIRTGHFKIPIDASYEEISKILLKR